MPYNRIPNDASLTPGYICQSIIDAAYYHHDDQQLMTRMMYEGFLHLNAQGITPRADSKSGYVMMVGGEDKHVYAEVRLPDTLRRAAVLERINAFRMPEKPPVSLYMFESMAGDIATLASVIISGFKVERNAPTAEENKQAYAMLINDFKDFGAHDATITLTTQPRYFAGINGRMTTPSKRFDRELRIFAGTDDRSIPLTQDEQRAVATDLVRDLASQGGVKIARG